MLILEDGTKVTDANTLITSAMVDAHATLIGNTAWAAGSDTAKEQAIYRAMAWFASLEPRMKGCRSWTDQELAWPRTGVCAYGREIDYNVIPKELKQALMEAALLEFSSPDALLPAQVTGSVSREKKWLDGVGGKETEYATPAGFGAVTRPKVMRLIAPFLNSQGYLTAF